MNPSPASNNQAARPQACHAKWTPPAWLLEIASGDNSLIADLIDVFKTSTEASIQQMRIAIATVDAPRLRTESHKMRGSAKQVGADALAEVCQTLELASSLTPMWSLGACAALLLALIGSAVAQRTAPPLG